MSNSPMLLLTVILLVRVSGLGRIGKTLVYMYIRTVGQIALNDFKIMPSLKPLLRGCNIISILFSQGGTGGQNVGSHD